ncbi:hypothetical protein HYC85_029727 [Camellia sinensis]|uniref:Alcohol dehydrogenase-like C-terminal domain-containing protein n=1 Tax=Camellia sinensis TaxID=4442 RepID=A0A7J7G2S3_CAMSI|nr:hypothetical protein HYC85_029727 [Camellia sinensis]
MILVAPYDNSHHQISPPLTTQPSLATVAHRRRSPPLHIATATAVTVTVNHHRCSANHRSKPDLFRQFWKAKMFLELQGQEASAIPFAALTAWRALKSTARIAQGQMVLVVSGRGAVSFATIQLAVAAEYHVSTTCGSESIDWAMVAGAEQAVDYTTQDIESSLKGHNWCTGDGKDRHQPFEERWALYDVAKYWWTYMRADAEGLAQIRRLSEVGKLKILVEKTFPITQVREAHEAKDKRLIPGYRFPSAHILVHCSVKSCCYCNKTVPDHLQQDCFHNPSRASSTRTSSCGSHSWGCSRHSGNQSRSMLAHHTAAATSEDFSSSDLLDPSTLVFLLQTCHCLCLISLNPFSLMYMSAPRIPHYDALLRILRYLKGTLFHVPIIFSVCD